MKRKAYYNLYTIRKTKMPVNRIMTSRRLAVWGNLPMSIKATPRWQKQVYARFTEIRLLLVLSYQ